MPFIALEHFSFPICSHNCPTNLAKPIIFFKLIYYMSNPFLVTTKKITGNWTEYGD